LTKLLEKSINKQDILYISYENIFHYLINDINFAFCMLMIFDKNFGMVVVRITKVMIAVKLGEQFIDSIKLPVFFSICNSVCAMWNCML
jgi:hypothetical protein